MVENIENWLMVEFQIPMNIASIISIILTVLGILLVCLIVDIITKKTYINRYQEICDENRECY